MKACHVQNLENIRSDNGLFLSLASTRTSFELALRMVVGFVNLFLILGLGCEREVKEMNQKVRKEKKTTRKKKEKEKNSRMYK